MRLSDFTYDLPESLIAQYPPAKRGDSRLMVLNGAAGRVDHLHFSNLPDLLNDDDLLVFNDTRVIPARLFGRKESGGKVEVMLERILDAQTVLAKLRASKSPGAGVRLRLEEALDAEVLGRDGEFFILRFEVANVADALVEYGHMPLPPYIRRAEEAEDPQRYQTVFARHAGAVAAPTAGLHFTDEFFAELARRGIEHSFVTLHVGSGTFQPVRTENLDEHEMHSEYLQVPADTVAKIEATRARGGRVIAVGTTVVRSLETAAQSGTLQAFAGESRLFLRPGSPFRVVDAMVTNFHLPQSTLLMLVCAFAGHAMTLKAYNEAVEASYRFFSYGDAMFVLPDRSTWISHEI
ncbi:tRNA preQ1(34) S-adenosylmethionine ribosyltransferase-isomerase QueA [Granulosicoccaceae sp. 1_MG-2023]|nr:tRNA preQ1(34) S-adenosylmethionine ribosyltransferase-isomerase QueA [Granulosicoccaceae sp. 1_MG-2023]